MQLVTKPYSLLHYCLSLIHVFISSHPTLLTIWSIIASTLLCYNCLPVGISYSALLATLHDTNELRLSFFFFILHSSRIHTTDLHKAPCILPPLTYFRDFQHLFPSTYNLILCYCPAPNFWFHQPNLLKDC